MSGGDLKSVAGHADGANEALFFRFDGGIDDTAWAEGYVPFDGVGEVVKLPEVDIVDAHAFERVVEFVGSFFGCAGTGFGGDKEVVAVLFQPGCDA